MSFAYEFFYTVLLVLLFRALAVMLQTSV